MRVSRENKKVEEIRMMKIVGRWMIEVIGK